MGAHGLEPWTSALSGLRSNQAELRARTSVGIEWAHMDSNHGPQPYQGCALTKLSYAPIKRFTPNR